MPTIGDVISKRSERPGGATWETSSLLAKAILSAEAAGEGGETTEAAADGEAKPEEGTEKAADGAKGKEEGKAPAEKK